MCVYVCVCVCVCERVCGCVHFINYSWFIISYEYLYYSDVVILIGQLGCSILLRKLICNPRALGKLPTALRSLSSPIKEKNGGL